MKVAVIGAGPSGITAAKNLRDAGFSDLTVFDRGNEVGGNWVFDADSGHSSVFETTHIISSREYSEYEDFPMPKAYPDYPGHTHLAAYFQAYAKHFDLYPHIQFRTLVESCAPTPSGQWDVTTRNEATGVQTTSTFDRIAVANGHHWKPRWPKYPGTFSGEWTHSHDFKRAEPFRGKRVLVIGGGNSACDCAVETSRVSAQTDISWRRGYWIVPKFLFGKPVDHIHHTSVKNLRWLPQSARLWGLQKMLRIFNGPNSAYGLPEPDHKFGETHPTLNSELLYFIRHGEIQPRPDIASLDGRTVEFNDGTRADYDAVICCTGFEISHPFFSTDLFDFSSGPVPLYLKMIDPRFDSVAFVGLVQPLGCIWPLAELQAKLLAKWWTGDWTPPEDLGAAVSRELDRPHIRQLETPRHTITVDFVRYRNHLLQQLRAA